MAKLKENTIAKVCLVCAFSLIFTTAAFAGVILLVVELRSLLLRFDKAETVPSVLPPSVINHSMATPADLAAHSTDSMHAKVFSILLKHVNKTAILVT